MYTNSENIEEYFSDVEYRLRKKFFMSDEMTLNFNVVFVERANISNLNGHKDLQFWIDKDVIETIEVHLYDFLVFTRYDVKESRNIKDGKIKIVNCECRTNKTWTIHDEFLEIK